MKTLLALTFLSQFALSHGLENHSTQPVLASIEDLKSIKAPIWASDDVTGVGFSYLTPEMQIKMQDQSHFKGKCGGFEVLPVAEAQSFSSILEELNQLKKQVLKDQSYLNGPVKFAPVHYKAFIEEAASLVQASNLHELVTWLSSYPSRNEKTAQRNTHVEAMRLKADEFLKNYKGTWKTELVTHTSSQQKSLKVTLAGTTHADEIIVLGGHHDSTVGGWGGSSGLAPGADDNASGSANLFEILRILAELPPQARSIEIMWYAAEESGLLGSAEIAKSYKAEQKNVIAVLQLDMTSFPGSGEMTIANITDFTSPWLHDLIKQLNQHYVGLNIIDDKCGYACSDHASWYRQGFSTAVPFEAASKKMNPNIHSKKDIVSPELSFKHSAAITQLSLAFALELSSNTGLRPPP